MNNEELMKPRYKVIADWPDSPFKVGEYLDQEKTLFKIDKYPHLFKKLEWWQERLPEEMPEYVCDYKGKIEKVIRWTKEYFIYERESTNPIILPNVEVSMSVIGYFKPATKEEYLNFNSQ